MPERGRPVFHLETAIAKWRQHLLASGIKSGEALDELESHLREELETKLRDGSSESVAFRSAIQCMGEARLLKEEFRKARSLLSRLRQKLKKLLLARSGVPVLTFATTTNMKTSTSDIRFEKWWSTYLKASLFALPLMVAWALIAIMVLPALNDVYANGGAVVPDNFVGIYRFHGAVLFLLRDNLFYILIGSIVTLGLLEWRAKAWPRYRRTVIGTAVCVLNSMAAVSFFIMVLSATIAARGLMHPQH